MEDTTKRKERYRAKRVQRQAETKEDDTAQDHQASRRALEGSEPTSFRSGIDDAMPATHSTSEISARRR